MSTLPKRRSPPSTRSTPDRFVNQTFQGDCVEILKRAPSKLVNTIIADPPYNLGLDYGEHYNDKRPLAEYLAWCATWAGEYRRVLVDDGTLWLVIGQQVYPEVDAVMQRAGFRRRRALIWHYTFGQNQANNFALSYTNLIYYIASSKFHFDPDICRVPSARQLVYADKRANPRGKLPDDVWFYRPQDLPGGLPADGDVWHCPRVAGTFRSRYAVPTQMPEQVVARCILMTTPPRGLVGDFMAGSGTTPAVCKKLGFRYTACELSEDYAAKMALRLDHVKEGDPLDGPSIQP
jgi:DNA modification methylase